MDVIEKTNLLQLCVDGQNSSETERAEMLRLNFYVLKTEQRRHALHNSQSKC